MLNQTYIATIYDQYVLHIFSKYWEAELLDFVADVHKPLQSLKKWFQITTNMI